MSDESPDDNPDGLAATGFIACKACGTRVRADREACLRCGEPLEAAPDVVTLQTISSGRPLMVAVGIAVGVIAIAALIWINRPLPEDDTVGVPTSQVTVANPSVTPPTAVPGLPPGADSGDQSEARSVLERALEANPTDPEAIKNLWAYHFNLAHTYSVQKQLDRAVAEYRIAARILPSDSATEYNLAVTLHGMGNEPAAIQEYRAAVRLAPDEARYHSALAASLEKTGDLAGAKAEFQTYLKLAPIAPDGAAIKAHLVAIDAGKVGTTP